MKRLKVTALALAAAGVGMKLGRVALRPRYRLSQKTVLITGGSRGLGLLMAHEFARQGARIVITARDAAELERAHDLLSRDGADVLAYPCDITIPSELDGLVATALDWFGTIDVLVNNAGTIQVGPMETMAFEDYERAMDTHFWAPLRLTAAVLPAMRRRHEGRIVNISSVGGLVSVPHLLPYCASKFALTGLSEGLAIELAKDGVKVTTVCPGLMRTGSARNAFFKGRHRAEYAWFSIADALPITSMSATRATRRIVTACRRGETRLVLSWQAKLITVANALFPGTTATVSSWINGLLPSSDGQPQYAKRGSEIASTLPYSPLTVLADRAARRTNQQPPSTLRWASNASFSVEGWHTV